MHVCEEREPTTFFAWSLLLIFILGFTCCWGRYLKPGMLGPTKGKLKPADKVVNGTLRNILRSDSLCSASSSICAAVCCREVSQDSQQCLPLRACCEWGGLSRKMVYKA